MNKKILALDIDGTIVDDKRHLGEETKHALLRIHELGHYIFFVSGRREIDLEDMRPNLHFADYLILNNGGKIISTCDNNVLQNICIDNEVSKQLISFCLRKKYILNVYKGMYFAVNGLTCELERYCKELGVVQAIYTSLDKVIYECVEGFTSFGNVKEVGAYICEKRLDLEYIESEPNWLDIMKKHVTKWNGIQFMSNHLNINSSNIITVGNYFNDCDMIEHAGIGIAVRNALDEVKAIADYVTERDNNHDAIAEVAEKFIFGTSAN